MATAVKQSAQKTSMLKVAVFLLAVYANINYLLFMLNPAHASNLPFFVITALADTIAVFIFLSTWGTALFFEVSRSRYYRELDDLRARGQHLAAQRVAVLVPVAGEDIQLIRHTLTNAMRMRGNLHIYVLDDGRRTETEMLCRGLGLEYVTRVGNAFYKAGNLNNGLRRVREDFVVVVDADFTLRADFVERTLPLFADPQVAIVQTPQVYYNEDTLFSRGAKRLQTLFYSYLQPGKHLLDSAFCVGTNVVYRMSALAEIGGIAQIAHSEDVFTSLALAERGYRTAYIDEPLAIGLAPSTLIAFFNQQFRWARGGFTMLRHNPLFNERLRLDQRFQFFFSNTFYLSGVAVLIYLVSPLIAVLAGVKPVSDQYYSEWLTKYALFWGVNFLFYLLLVKRNWWATLTLGMFSFVPYLAALAAVAFRSEARWKPTNARSAGLITTLLSPLIVYLACVLITGYLLFTGQLPLNVGFVQYYVWLALDVALILPFIVTAYFARSKLILPRFDEWQTDIEAPGTSGIREIQHASA